jgi:hypothetical protein
MTEDIGEGSGSGTLLGLLTFGALAALSDAAEVADQADESAAIGAGVAF